MIVTNQIWIQKEIKRTLNSGNACCHSVQNLLSSRLLSRKIIIRIYMTIMGARGSVVVKALCYKPEGRGSIPDEVNF
jgi:hypothetical protein